MSHDGGNSWSQRIRQNADNRFYFHAGGVVTGDGTVLLSAESFTNDSFHEPLEVTMFRSTDRGSSWEQVLVDTVQVDGPFFPGATLAADQAGGLALVYAGAAVAGGPSHVWVRRSLDDGATWSHRQELSSGRPRVESLFPAAVGAGEGDFRVWFMDDRTGRWNTW